MEDRTSRNRLVFLRGHLCSESRLGHRSGDCGLDFDGLSIRAQRRPDRYFHPWHQASGFRYPQYMSCAVFMFFYTIDAKTTDLMKTDLDARRAQAT